MLLKFDLVAPMDGPSAMDLPAPSWDPMIFSDSDCDSLLHYKIKGSLVKGSW